MEFWYKIEIPEVFNIEVRIIFSKNVEIIQPMGWNKISKFEQYTPVFLKTCLILSLFLSSKDVDAPEKFNEKELCNVCPSIADAADPVNDVLIT